MKDGNKSAKNAAEHSPKKSKISYEDRSNNSLEDIEEERGGKLISFDVFKQEIPIWLLAYISGFARYGNVDSVIQIFEFSKKSNFTFTYRYELYFYTDSNEYLLDLHGDSQMLLSVKNRKPQPGEINPRRKNLFIGECTPDKMEWVMAQIIQNELKNLTIKAPKNK